MKKPLLPLLLSLLLLPTFLLAQPGQHSHRQPLVFTHVTIIDATVRLRTTAAKRFKKVEHATVLIWKLLQVAESTFRRLKGAELLPAVYAGVPYVDGVRRTTSTPQRVAA